MRAAPPARERLRASASPEQGTQPILDALEQERFQLERHLESTEMEEARQQQGRLASMSLPPEAARQRILRYEASIERELHRTIRQLRQLRRQELGESPFKGSLKITERTQASALESVS